MSDVSGEHASDVRIELLRKVQLFEALTDADLRLISGVVDEAEMDEGTVLFEEGDPADTFYVVADGAVEIVRKGADGEEETLAARVTESGSILSIRQADFEWLLGGDSLSVRILSGLSRALRGAGVRFASVEKIES